MVKGVIAIILFLKLRVTVVKTSHSTMDQPQRQKLLCKFQKDFHKQLPCADDIGGDICLRHVLFFFCDYNKVCVPLLRRESYPL